MKKIFFSHFFLFMLVPVSHVCIAQSLHTVDSCLNVLKIEKDDTNKVKTLCFLSGTLLRSNADKSFEYANEALLLANKYNFKRGIIRSYQNIAGYYFYKSDFKTAMEYTQKAIPLIEQINDRHALGNIYANLSSLAVRRSDFSSAIDYSNKALEIGESLKDSNLISAIYGYKATIYNNISDYTTSLSYLFKALKINEAKHANTSIAANYFDIGGVYRLMNGNQEKAIYYTNFSLKIAREYNDQIQIASSLQQMGEIYETKKEWNKALDCFQQSLSISQVTGNLGAISSITCNVGLVYSELGQYDKAVSSLINALDISQRIGDKSDEATALGYLGEVYMKKKDYKSAVNYLTKSVSMSKQVGNKNDESCGLHDLSKCYKALNNPELAYDLSTQYSDLRDSILNEASINKTTEMEARYNFDRKEKEIALLTKDKKIQQLEIKKQTFLKNDLIGGLLLISTLFFFAYYNYRTRQKLKLQTLRNKIASDLHDDVGSTLSSISIFSEIARQQSSEVAPMLQQISENSSKMLESMADIVWTINPENDNFEKIILRMRSFAFELLGARKIDFEFNAGENISKLNLPMEVRKNLYLIFKEATNNLVKYSNANRASFSISSSKNNLTLLIRDNGKGFNTEKPTNGNGLKNMKNRATEIGAKFLIESEPGTGTTIQLLIKVA